MIQYKNYIPPDSLTDALHLEVRNVGWQRIMVNCLDATENLPES